MPLFRDGNCLPLQRWSEPAQIAFFTACCLLASITTAFLFSGAGLSETFQAVSRTKGTSFTIGAFMPVVFSPFLETIIIQWLPMLLLKIGKKPPTAQIAFSATIFSLVHLPYGFVAGIAYFIVGWILAASFLFCQYDSWVKGYRVTSIAHSIHNCILFLGYLSAVWL